MENEVFLAFGSNIEDRREFIGKALEFIKNCKNNKLKAVSNVYLTKAYGVTEQNNFFNCVCKIETSFLPFELLNFCKECEKAVGRTKSEKWGPRQIDVDILFYNDVVLNSDILTIPHKEFVKRDFFVLPMCDIAPDFVYPGLNVSVSDLLKDIKETFIVEKLKINF